MSLLPFSINFGVKAHFGRGDMFAEAATSSGFFNGIFFLAAAIAAGCAFADWALSKEQKRSIKEAVGDYWTALQYETLNSLFRAAWRRAGSQLLRLIGPHPLSLRRVIIPPALQVVLTYIVWWLLLSAFYSIRGWEFGPIHRPGIRIYNLSASATVTIPFFIWLFLVSWISWSGFATVLSRLEWSVRGILGSLCLFLAIAALVSSVTCAILLLYMQPAELLAAIKVEFPYFQLSAHQGQINVQTNDTSLEPFFGELLKAMVGGLLDFSTYARKFLWFVFKISVFCLVLGPSLFMTALFLLGVIADIFLKVTRPLIQPMTSLVLARLYESSNGVFAQIGIFVGATLKLIDEGIKRLG